MSDSRRQYRAIKKAMKQLYPEELLAPSSNVPFWRVVDVAVVDLFVVGVGYDPTTKGSAVSERNHPNERP